MVHSLRSSIVLISKGSLSLQKLSLNGGRDLFSILFMFEQSQKSCGKMRRPYGKSSYVVQMSHLFD